MTDINVFTFTGRLTRDAEMKTTSRGDAILSFSVACNGQKKDGERWIDDPSFFDCSMFGKRGGSICLYMTKGKQVGISGTLKQERWESSGEKKSRIVVRVNDIQLLGGANGTSTQSPVERVEKVFSKPDDDSFESDIPF